jgi:hypothetical protein
MAMIRLDRLRQPQPDALSDHNRKVELSNDSDNQTAQSS